jgi:hypothetical protein
MTIERDVEFEAWPAEADPIRMAALPLIEHIFAVSADGSAERSKAVNEVLAAGERIKQALASKPRLQ